MSSESGSFPGSVKHKFSHLFPGRLWRALVVTGLLLLLFYVYSFDYKLTRVSSGDLPRLTGLGWAKLWPVSGSATPTNLSHIVFGIVGSSRTWQSRKSYVEAWWRPNISRGYLFMDSAPTDESLLCPFTCPLLRINEDIRNWSIYPQIKFPVQIRMVRSIVEAYRQGDSDVRWFMMADDDSVLFIDNILDRLSKYDHTKHIYLGASSESVLSNAHFTFEMGFGGAGFALSYPLVATMAKKLDVCIRRYPYMWSADYLTYICILDLGVAISKEKGFHQIDLTGDISGLLSSHPQTLLLSLHHINIVNPIFPSMNRSESISHLMKPTAYDQSRLVQQTLCYQKEMQWSVSISWGYSVHIYESIFPRYILRKPLGTFSPWVKKAKWPMFMFNTRNVNNNPCEAPHWFFFESIQQHKDGILTTYNRTANRGLGPCSASGNHSADHISRIQVFSPAKTRLEGGRAECCDILTIAEKNTTTVKIRPCMEAEEIA